MLLVALIEQIGHVCARYRIGAFAGDLARRGVQLRYIPVGGHTIQRLGRLRAAAEADVVLLQRKLLPWWQLALLRRSAKRLVFDYDDAIYQRDSYASKPPGSWRRELRFWATVYAADAVMAGNAQLAHKAALYTQKSRVHVVPTCVNPDIYPMAAHRRTGADVRLVWIGQQRNLRGLALAAAHWRALARRLPGVQLDLVCDQTCQLPGVRVVLRRWSERTETRDVAGGDIGISYLPDDSWSRGKCGLKVLQYMAAGLPVVANSVGPHVNLVVPGKTGFLADTPEQWAEAILRLANDPDLRRRMGQAGRQRVEQHFSCRRWADRVVRILLGDEIRPRPVGDRHRRKRAACAEFPSSRPCVSRCRPGVFFQS